MATTDATLLGNAGGMFKDGAVSIFSNYGWVLWLLVGFAVVIGIGAVIVSIVNMKKQWTHTLKIRYVEGTDNSLSDPQFIRMKRFALITRAGAFILEKPLLGVYLISELPKYSKQNEYSIIVDKAGRIWNNEGEFFNPSDKSVDVAARHAGLDNTRAQMRQDWQKINTTQKKLDWAAIAKVAMWSLLIIAFLILGLKGIGAWADSQEQRAASDAAQAQTWQIIADVMDDMEGNTNANILLADKLKELYGTNNLQTSIRRATNETL